MQKHDILDRADIEKLVDVFYEYVLNDELLKPIFNEFMTHELEAHKMNIYNFWSFVIHKESGYDRNVMGPHLRLPIDELHFLRWLYYFRRTIYENFEGHNSIDAIRRAEIILFTMKSKITKRDLFTMAGS